MAHEDWKRYYIVCYHKPPEIPLVYRLREAAIAELEEANRLWLDNCSNPKPIGIARIRGGKDNPGFQRALMRMAVGAEHACSIGELEFQPYPAQVYWEGREIPLPPSQARLIGLLIREGNVGHKVLLDALGSTKIKNLHGEIKRVRDALREATKGQMSIRPVKWGYMLYFTKLQ